MNLNIYYYLTSNRMSILVTNDAVHNIPDLRIRKSILPVAVWYVLFLNRVYVQQ